MEGYRAGKRDSLDWVQNQEHRYEPRFLDLFLSLSAADGEGMFERGY